MGDLNVGLGGIVLLSEGFTTDVPRARERRLPDLQGLVRASSRFRVLAVRVRSGGRRAAAVPADADSGATEADPAVESSALLQSLARQTGGDSLPPGQDLGPALRRVSRDLDSYYVLTFTAPHANDGRFHPVQVTVEPARRAGARAIRLLGAAAERTPSGDGPPRSAADLPTRALRRSPFIESWFGLTVEPGGGRRIIFTWTPSPPRTPARGKAPARPDVVALKVTTPAGAVLFDGEVAAARAGNTSTLRPDSAVFQATSGRLQFDLTILQADGSKLDVGALDFDVPNVRGANPVILPPQLLSAGSAREFRDIKADANAAPLPGREFRRTERLLLRVPTFEPAGNAVQVSAKLVNRVGTVLIDLAPMPDEAGRTLIQFDLPLARFAPGEYSIEVAARSDAGTARELIRFRITG